MNHLHPPIQRLPQQQRGMSLIVVLMLLVIVSMLGVASMQIATMGEHGARNDRDMQLALQSAEAALIDAEVDIQGIWEKDSNGQPTDRLIAGSRAPAFKAGNARFPSSDCRSDGKWKGLCALETSKNKNATWLEADYEATNSDRDTVEFGEFTEREYVGLSVGEGGKGVQPALPPRYVIENVSELSAVRSGMVTGQYNSAMPEGGTASGEQLYRITAMGFGPRKTTRTVLQTIYRN